MLPPSGASGGRGVRSWLVDPDRPLPSNSRWSAVLTLARRFALAYDAYQIGRLSSSVRRSIGQTCTPAFARELLAHPPRLPSRITPRDVTERVLSVAPLEKLRASALVLVAVRRSLSGSESSGALELTLVNTHGPWLVSALSVLS